MLTASNLIFIFIIVLEGPFRATAAGGCPDQWYPLSGSCYRVTPNTSDAVPWGNAQRVCQTLEPRAGLPSFADDNHWQTFLFGVKFVIEQYRSDINRALENPKVTRLLPLGGFRTNTPEWYWNDGTQITFDEWSSSVATADQRCLAFDPLSADNGWVPTPCSSLFLFVCQLDTSKIAIKPYPYTVTGPVDVAAVASRCPSGWTSTNGGVCYKSTEKMLNMSEAVKQCSSLEPNATLPQFWKSDDYEDFVRYVGFNVKTAVHNQIALGGYRKSINDQFQNANGSWPYANWHYLEQPNGLVGNELCVYTVDTRGYAWSALPCSTSGSTVCQLDSRIKRNASSTVTAPQSATMPSYSIATSPKANFLPSPEPRHSLATNSNLNPIFVLSALLFTLKLLPFVF